MLINSETNLSGFDEYGNRLLDINATIEEVISWQVNRGLGVYLTIGEGKKVLEMIASLKKQCADMLPYYQDHCEGALIPATEYQSMKKGAESAEKVITQLRLEAGNLFDCLFYIQQAVTSKPENMTQGHWAALYAALAMAKDFSDEEHAPLARKEINRRLRQEHK